MKTIVRALVYSAAVLAASGGYDAKAVSLNFSTAIATNWTASAGGAVDATPYQHNTDITITSTGYGSGLFLHGGSFALFGGYWTAAYRFYLPADATSVRLTYPNRSPDAPTVLMLNGEGVYPPGVAPPPPNQTWYQFMVLTN